MEIRLENLHKSYRDAEHNLEVISELSASFSVGQSVSIVGGSGVGKSTLLHILGGLDRPSKGKVLFDGQNIVELSENRLTEFRGKNVGFIFQFHHLLSDFSALDNVSMPLVIAGVSERAAKERAKETLVRVGLKDRLSHRPGQLSGGEQQRVAVARAVVSEPAVILADEPTGNLDQNSGKAVQDLLLGLNKERNITLILATHNLELAASLDQKLEMLPGGKLKET